MTKNKLKTIPKYPWPNCVYWHVVVWKKNLRQRRRKGSFEFFKVLPLLLMMWPGKITICQKLKESSSMFAWMGLINRMEWRDQQRTSVGRANTKISGSKTRQKVDEFTNTLEKEDWVQESDVQVWRDPFLQTNGTFEESC